MTVNSSFDACAIIEEFCEGEGSTDEQKIEAFQFLIDSGDVWTLQGFYGRTARNLIDAGHCTCPVVTNPYHTAQWKLYGRSQGYFIWRLRLEGRDLFQVTVFELAPTEVSGYHNLEALLALKGQHAGYAPVVEQTPTN